MEHAPVEGRSPRKDCPFCRTSHKEDELHAHIAGCKKRIIFEWFARELRPGRQVVLTASGITGEIVKVNSWGVQVWNPMRGREKENWAWDMITIRQPRLIKRYPFPRYWRTPRKVPSDHCHCRIGKMEVVLKADKGDGEVSTFQFVYGMRIEGVKRVWFEVVCQRCKQAIGTESFPNRIRRAYELVRKADSPPKPEKKVSQGVGGTKPKTARTLPAKGKKAPRRVGVRPIRRRKEKKRVVKTRAGKTGNPKVPEDSTIPTSPGTETVQTSPGTENPAVPPAANPGSDIQVPETPGKTEVVPPTTKEG